MKQVTYKNMNGETVTTKIGDYISFKSDIEQSARVVEITSDRWTDNPVFIVEAPADGFSGHYIGREDFAEVNGADTWR